MTYCGFIDDLLQGLEFHFSEDLVCLWNQLSSPEGQDRSTDVGDINIIKTRSILEKHTLHIQTLEKCTLQIGIREMHIINKALEISIRTGIRNTKVNIRNK